MELFEQHHKEALEEIINISFGLAASLIADTIEKMANLVVPSVRFVNINELSSIVHVSPMSKVNYFVASQQFIGSIDGESLFLMDEDSSREIAGHLMGGIDLSEITDDDMKGCTLELANIITSACIGRLSELLGTSAVFSPPSAEKRDESSLADYNERAGYSRIICIETVLQFEEDEMNAFMFVLLKETSFTYLVKALEKFIENYGS